MIVIIEVWVINQARISVHDGREYPGIRQSTQIRAYRKTINVHPCGFGVLKKNLLNQYVHGEPRDLTHQTKRSLA